MRKKILYIAVGLLLTGCTSDDEQSGNVLGSDNAIVLGVKEVKSPESRAQHTGSMNFTELEGTGFGVYGYKGEYNNASSTPTLFAGRANTPVTFIADGTAQNNGQFVLVHALPPFGLWPSHLGESKDCDMSQRYTLTCRTWNCKFFLLFFL